MTDGPEGDFDGGDTCVLDPIARYRYQPPPRSSSSTFKRVQPVVVPDADAPDWESLARKNSRQPALPPANVREGMSVFEYLTESRTQGLAAKVMNGIFRAQRIPFEQQEDIAQEIRIAWSLKKVKAGLDASQVAKYGALIARTTALKTRRDIGGPVNLPGSVFRPRKDGSTAAQPGHLAPAVRFTNSIEGKLSAEESELDVCFSELMGTDAAAELDTDHETLADQLRDDERDLDPARQTELDSEMAERVSMRKTLLERHGDLISDRQRNLLEMSIAGYSHTQIAEATGIREIVVVRELSITASVMAGLRRRR